MLAIRMQRTGRKGHAMFRVVVQDSRRTPSSGKIVALLGHYDPHAKTTDLAKDKATFYLDNGAQPSDRVVRLFQTEGIMLPEWVETSATKSRIIRNQDKLRKNRPAEPATEEPAAEEVAVPDKDATEQEAAPETEAPTPEAEADAEEKAEA